MGQTTQPIKLSQQARAARDKQIIQAFSAGKHQQFSKYLSELILAEFPRQLNHIRKLMIYEDDVESVNEIITRFLELKFTTFQRRFSQRNVIDHREFLATLYLAIKHIIQDVLSLNDGYKKWQRLRKELIKVLKCSANFEVVGTDKAISVRARGKGIKGRAASKAIKHKPQNALGISNSDLELVASQIYGGSNELSINTLVNRCHDYLRDNGYIEPLIQTEFAGYESGADEPGITEVENRETVDQLLATLDAILSPKELEIFYLYYGKEMSPARIAKLTGVSSQLLNYYRNKTLKKIRQLISKSDGEIDMDVMQAVLQKMRIRYE